MNKKIISLLVCSLSLVSSCLNSVTFREPDLVPSSYVDLLEIKNETNWPLLLKIHRFYPNDKDSNTIQILKYRIEENKYSRFHELDINKIQIEPYGNIFKYTGQTKDVYECGKDRIEDLYVLIIKVLSKSKFKWDIERDIFNKKEISIEPLSSIKELNEFYLHNLVNDSWNKLNRNPAFVKHVFDQIDFKDLRYALGIVKDSDFISLKRSIKEKLHLFDQDTSPNLRNSSVFINFSREFFKYAYIKLILEHLNIYEKSISDSDVRDIISNQKSLECSMIARGFNKKKDIKNVLEIFLYHILNKISNIVS